MENDLILSIWPESIADSKKRKQVKLAVSIVISIVSGSILFGFIGWFVIYRRRVKRKGKRTYVILIVYLMLSSYFIFHFQVLKYHIIEPFQTLIAIQLPQFQQETSITQSKNTSMKLKRRTLNYHFSIWTLFLLLLMNSLFPTRLEKVALVLSTRYFLLKFILESKVLTRT